MSNGELLTGEEWIQRIAVSGAGSHVKAIQAIQTLSPGAVKGSRDV